MSHVNDWARRHPMGEQLLLLAVFVVTGVTTTFVLGGGFPWIGVGTALVVWALGSTIRFRRRTRS